jgi:hypothetical protein
MFSAWHSSGSSGGRALVALGLPFGNCFAQAEFLPVSKQLKKLRPPALCACLGNALETLLQ